MSYSVTFADFQTAFFDLFMKPVFKGGDYLTYLSRPKERRKGDEASIVDTAVAGEILNLLGFAPAERAYNENKLNSRPDFAPYDSVFGTCFIVEDKKTTSVLDFDLTNPDSHLSQLVGYMRDNNVPLGLLTNG